MIFAKPLDFARSARIAAALVVAASHPAGPTAGGFSAIRLLLGLRATEETSSRTPIWLLILRMTAAGLVIIALARPVLNAGGNLPGDGPVLLVIDDGWAAAADWSARLQAAAAVVDRAERTDRRMALLTTAPGEDGAAPAVPRRCRSLIYARG